MALSIIGAIKRLTEPLPVRIAGLGWTLLAGYDVLCSQLGLPTIKEIWGRNGSLLPWWGWLLILQGILLFALFEQFRRIPTLQPQPATADSATVVPSPEQKVTRLTSAEKERVSNALLAVGDYLDGDFEKLIDPMKELLIWDFMLGTQGSDELLRVAEAAREATSKLPMRLRRAIAPYAVELGLLDIDPMILKTKTLGFDDILHGIASVAQNMREPNIAAARIPCMAFKKEFDAFRDELARVKGQITRARHKLATGELG